MAAAQDRFRSYRNRKRLVQARVTVHQENVARILNVFLTGFSVPGCRYKPAGALGVLVECLWYWQGAPAPHLQERLLPQAQAAMILNLREEPIAIYEDDRAAGCYGTAVFSGARSNCFTIDCNQQERVVGVQFAPGGASPFFRMPMSELEDASFDMADLWGREAAWVRERVLAASTPQAMLQVLEQCLVETLRVPDRLHPAVVYMAGKLDICDGPARVQEVTQQIGLSQRRLAQLFHEQVGVSPKDLSSRAALPAHARAAARSTPGGLGGAGCGVRLLRPGASEP